MEEKTIVEETVDINVEVKDEVTPEVKPEGEVKKEIMIPKERFDEVNGKYKEVAGQLTELQKAKQDMEAQLEEIKKAEEAKKASVAEVTTKLEEQVKSYQSVIESMVEAKIQDIPEDMQDLIPESLTTEQKLSWLNKADEKGLFKKKVAQVEIGKPLNHSSEQNQAERVKKMNPLQALASYYSQNK